MGFGSYDESEQNKQTVETDEEAAIEVAAATYDGGIDYEITASTGELLEKLGEMKEE